VGVNFISDLRFAIVDLLACFRNRSTYRFTQSRSIMTRTTLSPKFQIVIPKDVRKALKLRPGTQFNVIEHEGRIELLPVRSPKQMRGFLRGIDTSVPREKDRV
jgi:AbrB family looped-hinge helix DNA binding protein